MSVSVPKPNENERSKAMLLFFSAAVFQ